LFPLLQNVQTPRTLLRLAERYDAVAAGGLWLAVFACCGHATAAESNAVRVSETTLLGDMDCLRLRRQARLIFTGNAEQALQVSSIQKAMTGFPTVMAAKHWANGRSNSLAGTGEYLGLGVKSKHSTFIPGHCSAVRSASNFDTDAAKALSRFSRVFKRATAVATLA
jgi:hypothetical protein